MESSTIIPSTTMRAARVTVFRGIPIRNIAARATAVQTGTPEEATAALLKGKSRSITKMTTRMEIKRSRRKLSTEVRTTRGWSVTRVSETLAGNSDSNCLSILSTSAPKATISRFSRIDIPISKVLFPLNWMAVDFFWIRRSTSATSSMRTTPPAGSFITIFLETSSSEETGSSI